MKSNLILPSLAIKYFKSLRDKNNETSYTYKDEHRRYFVRQSRKIGRCSVLNQCYKSTNSDEVFKIISKVLDVKGNIFKILDKYFEFEKKHRNKIENEYDSQFDENRDINQDEKEKFVNVRLSKLTIHEKLQKLIPNDFMMDFDATS